MTLPKLPPLAQIRKAIINATGLATSLLSLGLLPAPYAGWVSSGIAVATVIVHFWVENEPTPPKTVIHQVIVSAVKPDEPKP